MYSLTDPSLPYGTPDIESWAHTWINHTEQCRQIDIDAVIYWISRPVKRCYRNIENEFYSLI